AGILPTTSFLIIREQRSPGYTPKVHHWYLPCQREAAVLTAHSSNMKDFVVAIDLGTSCTAFSWKSIVDPAPSIGVPDMKPNEDIIGKSPTT
ncbi:unnamed protein product, partial [Ectocarpus sp. 12 AP-2014]